MSFVLPDWLEKGTISLIGDDEDNYSDPPDLTALPINLEEQTIVKDLLYCLIGAEGTYIGSNKNGKYEAKCIAHDSTMSFVEQILPICDDFAVIRRFAESHLAFENGRIIHAMCAALRTITSEYQQTIAKFENAKRLTPSLLLGNLQNPGEMLSQLSNFVASLDGKKGAPILTELHARLSAFRGSPKIRKLFTYIFQCASQPLLDFIQKWIFSGVVDDPYNEFFIEVDDTITPEDQGSQYESLFWDHRFKLVNYRIPKFISMSAVNSILLAGKTIAVLTLCGLQMPSPPKITLDALQRETILDSAALNASLRLVNALREKYNLLYYFKMFKAVFLCGRGDWVSKFISAASLIMEQPKDRIHIPALDAHLLSSLPNDYGKYFRSYFENENIATKVFNTLNLKSSYPRAKSIFYGKSSWDYFDMQIDVEWPISLLFNQGIISRYQLIFRTLLMWHHLESLLCKAWNETSKAKNIIPEVNEKRHAVHHFASCFLNFSAIDIIHPAWEELEDIISTTTDFGAICKQHDDTLKEITDGLLIASPDPFQMMMKIALDSFIFIEKFNEYQASVSSSVVGYAQRRALSEPLMIQYRLFEKDVIALIKQLQDMTLKTGNLLYGDFAKIININHAYNA